VCSREEEAEREELEAREKRVFMREVQREKESCERGVSFPEERSDLRVRGGREREKESVREVAAECICNACGEALGNEDM